MTSISKSQHMHPVSPVLFFKIILGKALEDGKLKLPNVFTRKYGSGLSKPLFLKPPDGTEWKVGWTKHDDEIMLENGWKEFATYYSLRHGHLVFFQYNQTSHIEVNICDMSGLEIDYPLNEDTLEDQINDETVEILDEMPPRQKQNTRMKKPLMFSSPQACKKLRTATAEVARTTYNLQMLPQHDQINGYLSQGTNFEKPTLASVKKELDEDISDVTLCPQMEKSTKVTEALNSAKTFRSRNPSFMVVMTPAYANSYSLYVPSNFADVYLKNRHGASLVQVQDGRTWTITYSQRKLRSGWKKFASDNNLIVGDICVFELVDWKGLSFKVSISRAAQEQKCLVSTVTVQENRTKWLDSERIQCVDSEADISNIKSGRKETQRTSTVIGTDSNEAMKEAKKFTSENPFFMFSLKPSFTNKNRPLLSTVFTRKYLKKEKQILTLRFGNKFWRVKLLCYSHITVNKLSSGWSQFTRETELKVGDVCIFELIRRDDALFDVHIFRCN